MIARRRIVFAVFGVSALLVAACSGDDNDAALDTSASTTTTTELPRIDDGQLTIGILRPASNTALRGPLVDASHIAIDAINIAGGVLDQPIAVVEADEGTDNASASVATEMLLAENVDAIIGPTSSNVALAVLDRITSAGVIACSPTASSLALDAFPDEGRFFRTIPSDSLQAVAIAEVAEETGALTAVLIHVDDSYGRPFAAAIEQALIDRDVMPTTLIGFASGDADLTETAQTALDTGAQIAIVVAAASETAMMLDALDRAGATELSAVIVNSAIREPLAAQILQELSSSIRTRIIGVAPQAIAGPDEPEFDPPGPYAVNAYDCVTMLALAALQAGSDDPQSIAEQMASVSSSGSVCRSFAQCSDGLDRGLGIDYNGPSGITEIRLRGEPSRARFDQFGFDASGTDVWESSFVVEG